MKKVFFYGLIIILAFILIGAGIAYHLLVKRTVGAYFDSKGVAIHYTDEGQGVPVILLHGFAVNADLNWRRPKIAQMLTRHYRVITMDLRGHGLSGKPHDKEQYGAEVYQDVIRLMDHLKIGKAHVMGYSLGGFTALKLASVYPERLVSVMPLASGWENPDRSVFFQYMDKLVVALKAGKSVGPIGEAFGKKRKSSFLHRTWVKLMTGYFNDRKALIALMESLEALGLTEDEVRAIKLPMMTVVGSDDILLAGAEALAEVVQNHQLIVVDDADHVQTVYRAETRTTILGFLEVNSGN
jgi:pimeloyl-ACP methyl ester carboxylesterase